MNNPPPFDLAPLEVVALTVRRGRRRLLDGLSFQLPAGALLEVAGPNGSGKTTLLRAMAGLLPLEGGSDPGAWAGQAFYFGDASGFRPELTVAAQLAFSLQLAGATLEPGASDQLLARVDLRPLAERPVRQLSHGQARRLLLAVMCASRRRLWLVDEPFNALDADAVALFGAMLGAHLAAGGRALIATHRRVSEVLPALEAQRAGLLELPAGTFHAPPLTRANATDAWPGDARAPSGAGALAWVVRRELALLVARPQDAAWPSVFFWMAVSLFPFGLGTGTLPEAAAGVFWICALFTMLVGAGRVFEADAACGALAQMRSAGLSLGAVAAGKLFTQWLAIGLPVAAASLVLGVQYRLAGALLPLLAGSLALGLLAMAALACLFATLGLMARQAQVVTSLLAFPLFVPLVIFGSAVVTGQQSGAGVAAPLLVLAGMAALSVLAVPPVAARLLAVAVE